MMAAVYLAAGFVLLIKGADWLVEGAVGLARRFGISNLVIGLTVVAFGTSAPELVVSGLASIQGNSNIALGNVLGSNIMNILLILGVAGLITPLPVPRRTVLIEIPLSLLAVVIVGIMLSDSRLDGASTDLISRSDALVLLGFFAIFLYAMRESMHQEQEAAEGTGDTPLASGKAILFVVIGLLCLTIGARGVVTGAVSIATMLGISESVIALTLVAGGTSLPELATSVTAARRGQVSIAVGNVVGSNLFNLFAILGIAGTIRPIATTPTAMVDLAVVGLATVLLLLSMWWGDRRNLLDRREAIGFLIVYALYLGYLLKWALPATQS